MMIQFNFQTSWEAHTTIAEYTAGYDECDSWQTAIASAHPKIRLQIAQLNIEVTPQFAPQLPQNAIIALDFQHQGNLVNTIRTLSDWLPFKRLVFNDLQRKTLSDITTYLTCVEALTFIKNTFKTLPKSFMYLKSLKYLDASSNDFQHFPKQILGCTQLTHLILSHNPIQQLPAEITALSQLEELHLENCLLLELPETLGQLKSLRILHLFGNQFTKLPTSLAQLTHLKVLTLGGNAKLDLAQAFGVLAALPNLQILDLRQMHLHRLPDVFYQLKHLKAVYLDDNPMSLENQIRVGANIHPIDTMSIYAIPQGTEIAVEIPAEIGAYTSLQSLTISYIKGLQKIAPEIGNLKQLVELNLSLLDSLKTFPDVLEQLTALKKLYLDACTGLSAYPPSLYRAKQIHYLHLKNNGFQVDMQQIKQMTWLKQLVLDLPSPESLFDLTTLIHLESLELGHNQHIQKLPEGFKALTKLQHFNFSNLPALDLPQAMAQLPYLNHIYLPQTLFEVQSLPFPSTIHSIHLENAISLQDLLGWMEHLPHLKSVIVGITDVQIPKNIVDLNRLNHATLNFNQNNIEIPLEWIFLDRSKITIRSSAPQMRVIEKAVSRIGRMQLSNTQHKMLIFGLLIEQTTGLEAFVENPFVERADLNGLVFYILGKPIWRNLAVLKTTLTQKGAKITSVWEKATHIFVGNTLGYSKVLAFLGGENKKFVLESFLKQYELEQETPFLIESDNSDLNQPILELLCSQEVDNCDLILAIIEGGGANRTLLSYVTAISLKHPTESTRTTAQILFQQYASANLQAYIMEHWQVYMITHSYAHERLYMHPDIDFFDAVVAEKMIFFHHNERSSLSNHSIYEHAHLFVMNYDWHLGSSGLQRMPFITHIQIESPLNFDFQVFMHLIKDLSLTFIDLSYLIEPIELAPLFDLKTLDTLRIDTMQPTALEIPLFLNANLTNLQLTAAQFTHFERLGAYIQQIKNLIIHHRLETDPRDSLPF
jgi:leucine-rich repeat protein SHOC2